MQDAHTRRRSKIFDSGGAPSSRLLIWRRRLTGKNSPLFATTQRIIQRRYLPNIITVTTSTRVAQTTLLLIPRKCTVAQLAPHHPDSPSFRRGPFGEERKEGKKEAAHTQISKGIVLEGPIYYYSFFQTRIVIYPAPLSHRKLRRRGPQPSFARRHATARQFLGPICSTRLLFRRAWRCPRTQEEDRNNPHWLCSVRRHRGTLFAEEPEAEDERDEAVKKRRRSPPSANS